MDTSKFIIVTTSELPGMSIVGVHGCAISSEWAAQRMSHSVDAKLVTQVKHKGHTQDEVESYKAISGLEPIDQATEYALEKFKNKALALGGNAVIGW